MLNRVLMEKLEDIYAAFFMAISFAQLQSSSLPVRFRAQILISSRRRQLNVGKITLK